MEGDNFEKSKTVRPNKEAGTLLTILRLVGALGRAGLFGAVCAFAVPSPSPNNIATRQNFAILPLAFIFDRMQLRDGENMTTENTRKRFTARATGTLQTNLRFEFDANPIFTAPFVRQCSSSNR